jgi:stress-induced morphogen
VSSRRGLATAQRHVTDIIREETSMTDRAQRIASIIDAAFAPSVLEVEDDSAKHAGHAGARPGGETHYTVTIESAAFNGLNRVARHRKVTDVLSAEFATGLHALSLRLRAPGEAER